MDETALGHAMAEGLDCIVQVLVHAFPIKPSDPQVWNCLAKLDQLRKDIHALMGSEPADIHDPQGRQLTYVQPATEE